MRADTDSDADAGLCLQFRCQSSQLKHILLSAAVDHNRYNTMRSMSEVIYSRAPVDRKEQGVE